MTALRIFQTATPTRDHAPLIGADTEFMALLASRRAASPSNGARPPHTRAVEAGAGKGA